MKKTLILILILVMICSLCACTFPAEIQVENPDGSQTVAGAVIKQAVLLFFSALGTGITFIGGWVLRLLGRNTKLKNLVLAWERVCNAAQQTCAELQQTTVDEMKAQSRNGKLTDDQIKALGVMLLSKTKAKLDSMTVDLLTAAGADINAIIIGACEADLPWIKANAKRAAEAGIIT